MRTSKSRNNAHDEESHLNVRTQSGLPPNLMVSRMTTSYVPVEDQHMPHFERARSFVPTEQDRDRVTKNLFPQSRREDSGSGINFFSQRPARKITTDIVVATQSRHDPCATISVTSSSRPIAHTRTTNPDRTYPKLLAGVELFSPLPPPPGLDINMEYPGRTGAGYKIIRADGTSEYQYFPPLDAERCPVYTIEEEQGGYPDRGHGIFSDPRHTDLPMGSKNNQYEIAHQPVFPDN